jgi:radical SAM superfamily enzyme YgiQ (UPF0313 family)
MGYDIIITTDRTMMTNHHKREFIGFMTTSPPIGMPESLWLWLSAPKPKVDAEGKPLEAPYGLRKIEAALLDAGFKAAVIDPDHIEKHFDTAKIIMIGHHDFFAYGPPSSEWWGITGNEPVNRRSFIRFMESPAMRKAVSQGKHIVIGGPAAWQWFYEIDFWRRLGVTTVIDGEGERIVPEVVEKLLNGEEVPRYIYVGVKDSPSLDEIPIIKRPSVNGLVEIMRGCPRGCQFCSVTLRPLRFIPLDKIEAEVLVNVRNGVDRLVLHSEDVFLYGADGVKPRPEPLLKLHKTVLRHVSSMAWSHASLAAVKYAEEHHRIVSRIMELVQQKQDYLGVEVGIETGSSELAKKVMPAKALPYPVEKWPEIVEDAFRVMHENNIIPAATLIIGLPGETPDDVVKTIELMDRLKPYRSLIVPMMFVPMGALKNKEFFRKELLDDTHMELYRKCLEHSLYWAEKMLNEFYLKEPYHFAVRALVKALIKVIKYRTKEFVSRPYKVAVTVS